MEEAIAGACSGFGTALRRNGEKSFAPAGRFLVADGGLLAERGFSEDPCRDSRRRAIDRQLDLTRPSGAP